MLFITAIVTITITLFVHNFISFVRLIIPSVAKACVYNETTNNYNYNYECHRAVSNASGILVGGSTVLAMFFTLLMIPVYMCSIEYRQHIKEDLETFDVESAKIDN